MDVLDVKGLSCPLPVTRTKKFLDTGVKELRILGTGNTAKQNVTRFAKSQGFKAEITAEADGEWTMILTKLK
ncbi:MAG: sulfurtransferase TusA family protein [Syntrophomonadales bacterium]|jgi:tRNA 2-thiouridine synthesizing protein A